MSGNGGEGPRWQEKPDIRVKTLHMNKREARIVAVALMNYHNGSGKFNPSDREVARELSIRVDRLPLRRRAP